MNLKEEIFKYKFSEEDLINYSNKAIQEYNREKTKIDQDYVNTAFVLMPLSLFFLITFFVINAFFYTILNSILLLIALSLIIFLYWKGNTKKKELYRKYKKYFELEKYVNNFNITIEEIEALLSSPKAREKLPKGENLLEMLELIKGDLVSALKLERIYRENPNYEYDKKLNTNIASDDYFTEIANRINTQGNQMNDLLNNWQQIREAINEI